MSASVSRVRRWSLLTRFDGGAVDRVTAPSASRRGGRAAGRTGPPAAQLPAKPMLTSPAGPVRVSRASLRRVRFDEGDTAGAVRVGRPVRDECRGPRAPGSPRPTASGPRRRRHLSRTGHPVRAAGRVGRRDGVPRRAR